VKLDRGTVVLVGLDPTLGHEQRGVRPCIIVSDPEVTEDQRFPAACVVPITGTPGQGALYPILDAGSGGLRQRSWALLDQIRTVDKRRVRRVFGKIPPEELAAVDEGLRLLLGLR
jgi:mRNA interferase MazF